MGERGRAVAFAGRDARTTIMVVRADDAVGVERALERLTQHRVLGLGIKWPLEHVSRSFSLFPSSVYL